MDPITTIAIQYLTVEEIMTLCKTNREYRDICKKQSTWKFLLERDFEVVEAKNPEKEPPRPMAEELYRPPVWQDKIRYKEVISRRKFEKWVKNDE